MGSMGTWGSFWGDGAECLVPGRTVPQEEMDLSSHLASGNFSAPVPGSCCFSCSQHPAKAPERTGHISVTLEKASLTGSRTAPKHQGVTASRLRQSRTVNN